MAKFVPGRPITTEQPFIDVDAGLSVGTHRFQLVVVDTQGNRSAPDIQVVTVVRRIIPPPTDPIVPVVPVSPTPITPIRRMTPTPVRSAKKVRRPQGRTRPRRGGT
ncbi:MAG: hypothetical protein OEY86_02380 [Nitrospira sp.]|nr:hypothetical protein [Nitrospira sp.]